MPSFPQALDSLLDAVTPNASGTSTSDDVGRRGSLSAASRWVDRAAFDGAAGASTPLPPPQLTARGIGLAALFWLLYALLYALLIAQSEPALPFFFAFSGQIVASAILGLYSLPAWGFIIRVLDRASWVWTALAHLVVAPLYAWVGLESYLWVMDATIGSIATEEIRTVDQWILFSNLTVYALQFAVFHMLRSRRRLRWKEQQALELFALARERELEALKAQVNPHFLFNTLNSINATVTSDPEQARAMLVGLADLMRYALDSSNRSSVSLREEVRFVRAYLDLERHRFSDRLRVEYDVDATSDVLDATVPPMVLHPLVENALKHGIAPSESGGTVALRITPHDVDGTPCVRVMVEDTGVGPSDETSSGTGVGLSNTQARLERTYGDVATLHTEAPDAGGFRVWFDVPRDA